MKRYTEKLTDDRICEALKNNTYFEAKDLKEMKKQPNVQDLYIKLNEYEKLMEKYEIDSVEALEEILKDYDDMAKDIVEMSTGVKVEFKENKNDR